MIDVEEREDVIEELKNFLKTYGSQYGVNEINVDSLNLLEKEALFESILSVSIHTPVKGVA